MGHKAIQRMSAEEKKDKQQTAKRSIPYDVEAISVHKESRHNQHVSLLQEKAVRAMKYKMSEKNPKE